jgi:hypothetical protein
VDTWEEVSELEETEIRKGHLTEFRDALVVVVVLNGFVSVVAYGVYPPTDDGGLGWGLSVAFVQVYILPVLDSVLLLVYGGLSLKWGRWSPFLGSAFGAIAGMVIHPVLWLTISVARHALS